MKNFIRMFSKGAHLNLTVFHNIFPYIWRYSLCLFEKYKMNLAAKLLLDGKRKIGDIAWNWI